MLVQLFEFEMMSPKSIYVRRSKISQGENEAIEFKGHRRFAVEEVNYGTMINQKGHSTKRHISMAACGMLNSRRGGVIFMGVLDNGDVEGFMMSPFQLQHLELTIEDAFQRFRPKVPEFIFRLEFVPVIEKSESIYTQIDPSFLHNSTLDQDVEHVLRTTQHCWCDLAASAALSRGILHPFWVIELHIFPFNESTPGATEFLAKDAIWETPNKLFRCEDGRIYIRRSASIIEVQDNLHPS